MLVAAFVIQLVMIGEGSIGDKDGDAVLDRVSRAAMPARCLVRRP
jgi:hypothetical protein